MMRTVDEVRVPGERLRTSMVITDAIRAVLWQGAWVFLAVVSSAHTESHSWRGLLILVAGVSVLGALAALPYFIRALWLLLRYGPIAGSLKQVGHTLLVSLANNESIRTEVSKMRVRVQKVDSIRAACWLEGGTSYEKSLFLDALEEVVSPIEDPRYLLVRRSRLGFIGRADYHAVPGALRKKKEHAEYFARRWNKHVGSADLIYTRTPEGRRQLLFARGHSLAAALQKRSERRNAWK